MLITDNKDSDLMLNDAASIDFSGKTYRLEKGFHLLGRRCKQLNITDNSVDDKHALIIISSSGHQIVDLESENGTFVDNERVSKNFVFLNKTSSLKLGNFIAKYTILNQSDSGFLDSKTNIPDKDESLEVIASSPEESRYGNGIRNRHIRNRRANLTNSSTPNANQSSISDPKPSISQLVPAENGKSFSNAENCDLSVGDKSSFFVPETQQIVDHNQVKQKPNFNIFDTIVDENVKQFMNDMSKDDDYYVPETQEIFLNAKKIDKEEEVYINTQDFNGFNQANENSNSGENTEKEVYISTQDFNGFNQVNENSNSSSDDLCRDFDISKTVTDIKKDDLQSSKIENRTVKANETDEMSQLKWNDTEISPRSGSTTPDIHIDLHKSLLGKNMQTKNESLHTLRELSVTPDLEERQNFQNEEIKSNKENVSEFDREGSVTPDLELPSQKHHFTAQAQLDNNNTKISSPVKEVVSVNKLDGTNSKSPDSNKNEFYNEFMDEEDTLLKTQCFLVPSKITSHKSLTKTITYEEEDDLLEETQIFCHTKSSMQSESMKRITPANQNEPRVLHNVADSLQPLTLTNQTDIGANSIELEEVACTQAFVVPVKQNKNFNRNSTTSFSNITNDETDCTQIFVHPNSIDANLKENNRVIEASNDSVHKPQNKIIDKLKLGEKSKIRKRARASETGENLKKQKLISNVPREKSNSSSGSSKTDDLETPPKSQFCIDADFMLDICTPSIDLIKLPVSQEGYINALDKVKLPVNKIFVEETDDEDEYDEIESKLMSNTKENMQVRKTSRKTKKVIADKIIEVERNLRPKRNNKFFMEETESPSLLDNILKLESGTHKPTNLKTKQKKSTSKSSSTKSSSAKTKKTKETSELKKNSNEFQIERKSTRKKGSNPSLEIIDLDKSENNSNSLAPSLSSRSSRSNKINKFTLAFTKVDESEYAETVNNIGYTIVKDPEDASLLITNNEISRTWKFLICLARGIPIVSVDWLHKIQEANFSYVPYDNYFVHDQKTEKRFNFSLKNSLNLATNAENPLFNHCHFIITQNTVPPKHEIERIIQCAGGKIIDSVMETSIQNLFVVSDKKDSKEWPKLKNIFKNLKIMKTEGILLSIMQQRIRFDDHLFKT